MIYYKIKLSHHGYLKSKIKMILYIININNNKIQHNILFNKKNKMKIKYYNNKIYRI